MDEVPHNVNVLVNQGLSAHRGSHETVVVSQLEVTMIFYFTEVNGMNPVHIYGRACHF